jgi:hypothetical protein
MAPVYWAETGYWNYASLDWKRIRVLRSPTEQLDAILDRHRDVFRDELGRIRGVEAKIHIEPDPQPQYCRPRTVLYAVRGKVMSTLEHERE